MYNTAKDAAGIDNGVKATGKLMKNNALVLILRSKDNTFITFTINTRQP